MEIRISTAKARVPVTIVHIVGNVDSATYPLFQSEADGAIEKGARHILIDFSETPFVSSAGFRVLHNIFSKLRSVHNDLDDDELRRKIGTGAYNSPYMKVAKLSSQVRDAFIISGFDTYIEVCDDLTKAVASF